MFVSTFSCHLLGLLSIWKSLMPVIFKLMKYFYWSLNSQWNSGITFCWCLSCTTKAKNYEGRSTQKKLPTGVGGTNLLNAQSTLDEENHSKVQDKQLNMLWLTTCYDTREDGEVEVFIFVKLTFGFWAVV